MGTLRTGQTTDYGSQTRTKASDFTDSFSVDHQSLDSSNISEYSYTPKFNKYHGYYRKIPELRGVINKLASWTFGRGIKADKSNQAKLNKLKGFGKDSPRSILKNQWRTALICGDSFAHIIRDNQGRLTNVKPLNPQIIKVISNEEGILVRYEIEDSDISFSTDEIYHLSYERIADETHGVPFPEALEELILSRNEALEDLRVLYHRNIKPIQFFEVETSDQTKLNSVESTINEAYRKSENVVIPAGVVKEIKRSSTPQYGTADTGSLNYIKFLVRQFVTACGMPEVIMGWGSETTEASSKIIYLAFQQEIEDMQLYNQEQIEAQLGIKVNLEFPASIESDLIRDQEKDKGQVKELNTNPEKDG